MISTGRDGDGGLSDVDVYRLATRLAFTAADHQAHTAVRVLRREEKVRYMCFIEVVGWDMDRNDDIHKMVVYKVIEYFVVIFL